jgi:hypothetical protein
MFRPTAGDIGEEIEHIEFEPFPESEPVKEPAPEKAPERVPEPAGV